jgi:acyl-CoA thioester hydrolase
MADMVSDAVSAAPTATSRSAYRHWTHDTLRYNDLDGQGHVNNAVYSTFFETGRVTLFRDRDLQLLDTGENIVIVRIEIDYRSELHYPGIVDIGTRVLKIGRTSFRLGAGVFDGERCVATSEAVIVLMDDITRQAKPLSPKIRAWLEGQLAS